MKPWQLAESKQCLLMPHICGFLLMLQVLQANFACHFHLLMPHMRDAQQLLVSKSATCDCVYQGHEPAVRQNLGCWQQASNSIGLLMPHTYNSLLMLVIKSASCNFMYPGHELTVRCSLGSWQEACRDTFLTTLHTCKLLTTQGEVTDSSTDSVLLSNQHTAHRACISRATIVYVCAHCEQAQARSPQQKCSPTHF